MKLSDMTEVADIDEGAALARCAGLQPGECVHFTRRKILHDDIQAAFAKTFPGWSMFYYYHGSTTYLGRMPALEQMDKSGDGE